MLPILGYVGIQLCTLEYSGNGIPLAGFECVLLVPILALCNRGWQGYIMYVPVLKCSNRLSLTYMMPYMIGTHVQSLIVVCPEQFLFLPFSNSNWLY